MFKDSEIYSGIGVKDVDEARAFYGDVLGIGIGDVGGGMISLKIAGSRDVLVYPAPNHTPASYTVLNIPVEDIDAAVDAMTEAGISFERYEGSPQDDKGVMRGLDVDMGPDIAWFTDPSGNVLSVQQQTR